MLSSPRLQGFDFLLLALTLIWAARVVSPDMDAASAPGQARAEPEQAVVRADATERLLGTLSDPMPNPPDVLRYAAIARLDYAMRCMGLAEVERQSHCTYGPHAACWDARIYRTAVEYSLWPKGRPGQLAMAYRGKVDAYADAYAMLARQNNHTSELIRRRDGAMCRRYQAYFEARLHDSEDRQSRGAVQESPG